MLGEIKRNYKKRCNKCKEIKHKRYFQFVKLKINIVDGEFIGLLYVGKICDDCDRKEGDQRSRNSILTIDEYRVQQWLTKKLI